MIFRILPILGLLAGALFGQDGTAVLGGRLIGSDGKGLAGAVVVVIPVGPAAGPGKQIQATSGADGSYSFSGLAAGSYVLRATRDGYLNSIQAFRNPGSSAIQNGNTPIVLKDGQKIEDHSLALVAEGVVSGTITREDGAPMKNVQIRALRTGILGNSGFGGTTSDDKGTFRINGLSPGKYSFYCMPPSEEAGYAAAPCPGLDSLDVTEGLARSGLSIKLRKSAVVHVRGKVQNGLDPSAHFQILYNPATTDIFLSTEPRIAVVKADGTFELSDIFANSSWSLALMSVRGLAKAVGSTTVSVKDQDVTDLVLTAGAPVTVKGSVRMEDKSPLQAGSMIALRLAGSNNSAPVRATPEADGSFTIPNLAPARYQVLVNSGRAYAASAQYGSQDVLKSDLDLSSGSGTLDIVLSTAVGQVSVTVSGSDGKPAGVSMVLLVPDPPQVARRDLYRVSRTGPDGKAVMPAVPVGKYRVLALDASEMMGGFSPESVVPVQGRGLGISVESGATAQAAVTVLGAQ